MDHRPTGALSHRGPEGAVEGEDTAVMSDCLDSDHGRLFKAKLQEMLKVKCVLGILRLKSASHSTRAVYSNMVTHTRGHMHRHAHTHARRHAGTHVEICACCSWLGQNYIFCSCAVKMTLRSCPRLKSCIPCPGSGSRQLDTGRLWKKPIDECCDAWMADR